MNSPTNIVKKTRGSSKSVRRSISRIMSGTVRDQSMYCVRREGSVEGRKKGKERRRLTLPYPICLVGGLVAPAAIWFSPKSPERMNSTFYT
jgi:hypothetical protein